MGAMCRVTVALLAATLGPTAVSAQSIRGIVTDVQAGEAVVAAELVLERGGDSWYAITDAGGTFAFRDLAPGTYVLRATSLGYRAYEEEIEVESTNQRVDLWIKLSTAPVELEGITVVARGVELRHRNSLAGFLVRKDQALSVGTSRVVTRDEGPIRASSTLNEAMRWFLPPKGCLTVYVDGMRQPRFVRPDDIRLIDAAGLEYYRDHRDAPLEMRGPDGHCVGSRWVSVVAIWTRPPEAGGT